MSTPRDRTAIVTTAVQNIISTAAHDSTLRQQLEDVLRDEFAGIEREIAAEQPDPEL